MRYRKYLALCGGCQRSQAERGTSGLFRLLIDPRRRIRALGNRVAAPDGSHCGIPA